MPECFISQSFCRTDAEEVERLVEEHFPKLDGKVLINDICVCALLDTNIGRTLVLFMQQKAAQK